MKPFISVIIPYYNARRFIHDAVASIRAQNYAELEIIIIDDGSTEALPPELLSGTDIRVLKHENKGPAAARNTGLRMAKGDLIAFLDADDLWPLGKLAMQVARFEAEPVLQVVGGRIRYEWLDNISDSPVGLEEDGTILHAHLGALVTRKSVFDIVGGFNENLRFSEDHDWWLRLREQGIKTTALDAVTLIYRRHAGNMTRDVPLNKIGLMEVLKHSLDRRRKNNKRAQSLSAISAFNERLPLVSTILPVYNGAAYVRETIESLFAQTYRAHEIIVIDDGSTDDSAAILAEFSGRLHTIHQTNAGVAAARNRGLAGAQGQYIAFIDQDDLWPSDKLALQVDYLETHPEIDYVLGAQNYFLSPGHTRPAWIRPDLLDREHTGYLLGTLLARRKVFDIVGNLDENYTVGDDSAWFFKAKDMKIPMAIMPQRMLNKRAHDANNSAKISVIKRDLLTVVHQSIGRQRKGSS